MRPSDPITLNHFTLVYQVETVCAAYLGFKDIGDIRRFVLSHFFLEHFLSFQAGIGSSTSTDAKKSLEEIRDNYLNPASGRSKYPVDSQDRAKTASKLSPGAPSLAGSDQSTARRLTRVSYSAEKMTVACILILMVEDVDSKAETMVDPELQADNMRKLNRLLPTANSRPNIVGQPIRFPKFTTNYATESRIEAYNRAFNLLKYANRFLDGNRWYRNFRTMGPGHSRRINENDTPPWMRGELTKRAPVGSNDGELTNSYEPPVPQNLNQTRVEEDPTVLKRHRPSLVIDLGDSSEPEDLENPEAQESSTVFLSRKTAYSTTEPIVPTSEPMITSRELERSATSLEDEISPTRSKLEPKQGEDGDDDSALQMELEEAELKLEIVHIKRKMAVRKNAKLG